MRFHLANAFRKLQADGAAPYWPMNETSGTSLLVMIGINLALPFFVGGIAWQAHLGGGVTGAAVGGLLLLTSTPERTASLL